MPVPCDCCASGPPRCARVAVRFSSAAQTVAEAGWNPTSVAATADGVTNTAAISGYTTGGATFPSSTLRVEYTTSAATDHVRGLRLWNQCGSDLGDADGLGQFQAEFYAGATLLTTLPCTGGNGGAPFTFLFPGNARLDGVTRVVLRNLSTQGNVNGVKPLWRELQLIQEQQVFPCRRTSGTIEWYDQDGNLVPTADVGTC